jgi:surface protein
MFQSCFSLKTVPLFDTGAVTNMTSMFLNCYVLTAVPLFNMIAVTNMTSMFQYCASLTSIPALNVSAVTTGNFATVFNGCVSLSKIEAYGFKFSFSVASCKLSDTSLNALFSNLGTTTGQTITASGNYDYAASNTTLATAKGWAVN